MASSKNQPASLNSGNNDQNLGPIVVKLGSLRPLKIDHKDKAYGLVENRSVGERLVEAKSYGAYD